MRLKLWCNLYPPRCHEGVKSGLNVTHKAHMMEVADEAARDIEWVLQVHDVLPGEGLVRQQVLWVGTGAGRE